MSDQIAILRDAAIGETREAMLRGERVVALRIARASDAGRVAHWGEVFAARIAKIDRRRRGAFVDLGLPGQQGFLPLGADGRAACGRARVALSEGMNVTASIVREAARAKSPVVELLDAAPESGPPGLIARPECDEDLALAKPGDRETRARIDHAIDDALSLHAPIPGGGALTIEPCAALVAIDVDAGGRQGQSDAEKFALDLNIAAAREAALQIRLRGLGGVMAIDFVSMRQKSNRDRLDQAIRTAFADDPWSVQFGGFSRFGVYEMARAQFRTPLHEILRAPDGRLSAETIALSALRAIEREARAVTGRHIVCSVAPEIKAWLDAAPFDWRAGLSNRIGLRWSMEAVSGPRDRIDVKAQ